MIFVPTTSWLEYYNSDPRPGFSCYADIVFVPHDILLQVPLSSIAAGYTLQVRTYKPDGVTLLADDTADFEWYYAQSVYGVYQPLTVRYANIRCNQFSTAMYDNVCFVLRVTITTTGGGVVFDQYTQKYELDSYGNGACSYPVVLIGAQTSTTPFGKLCRVPATTQKCYEHLMRLTAIFDCYDTYTGDFYGDPGTVYGGNAASHFPFVRQCYVPMRMYEPPFELKRTISLNCRTQKTEVTPKFMLRGEKAFPAWKKREMEYMWLANHLYVDGQEWQSEGGTIFSAPWKPYPYGCIYHYKFEAPIQSCYQYQIFGCGGDCRSQTAYYRIARQSDKYYDDAGALIATSADELLNYFTSLNNVQMVQDVTVLTEGLSCENYLVINVVSEGTLPSFLYTGYVNTSNRIFPKYLPAGTSDLSPLCDGAMVYSCGKPALGIGVVATMICDAPALGTGIVADATDATLMINDANNWVANSDATSATVTDGVVTVNFSAKNTGYNSSTATTPFVTELIGVVSGGKLPVSDITLYASKYPQLPAGSTLTISGTSNPDGGGRIYYTGSVTDATGTSVQIEFYGLKYGLSAEGVLG